MAINLWRLQKPTSYNPLPTGWVNRAMLGIGDYVVNIKANSLSSASLRVKVVANADFDTTLVLTPTSKVYTLSFTSKSQQYFDLYDVNSKGDIIIDSIELVNKPLPKLTINGIDGFKSGKWTLHANAIAVDDETLVLNATESSTTSYLNIPVTNGKTYYFNIETTGLIRLYKGNIVPTSGTPLYMNDVGSFTVDGSFNGYVTVRLTNSGTGTFTFKRPMLNMGSIPAPYSKKTGERMVQPVVKKNLFDGALESGSISTANGSNLSTAGIIRSVNYIPVKPNQNYAISKGRYVQFYDANKTWISSSSLLNDTTSSTFTTPSNCYFIRFHLTGTDLNKQIQLEQGTVPTPYEPYAVQVNKKPMRYVPKKNLFNKATVSVDGWRIDSTNGTAKASAGNSYSDYIPVQPNKPYVASWLVPTGISDAHHYSFYDVNKTFISGGLASSFTAPSNAYYLRVSITTSLIGQAQLEEGTTATPYEPYQLVLPKAKTGLQMDGVSNYVQLPSMTMDAIEIECLIDAVQKASYYLLDCRVVYALDNYVNGASMGSNVDSLKIDSVSYSNASLLPKNQRIKPKITFKTPVTTGKVFSMYTGSEQSKGIIYKVTCYLAGQVVAQYDFENPSNLVADKLIPNAKNLIPSFEDTRWSLHSNFRVLGRDVGRLDASAGFQTSNVIIPCLPNQTYMLSCQITGGRVYGDILNSSNGFISNTAIVTKTANNLIFTTPSNASSIKLWLDNQTVVGTLDFIRPQLYQLSNEATLYGGRNPKNKSSRRVLYAKR